MKRFMQEQKRYTQPNWMIWQDHIHIIFKSYYFLIVSYNFYPFSCFVCETPKYADGEETRYVKTYQFYSCGRSLWRFVDGCITPQSWFHGAADLSLNRVEIVL